METTTLIEQTVGRYRDINRLGMEIEQAVQERDFVVLPGLCARLEQMQAEAKDDDATVLAELARREHPVERADLEELLALMRRIDARNRHLIPRIRGIMAVQRDALRTLRLGAAVLQSYTPAYPQTGRRIAGMG